LIIGCMPSIPSVSLLPKTACGCRAGACRELSTAPGTRHTKREARWQLSGRLPRTRPEVGLPLGSAGNVKACPPTR
jgi:hypothetical protein